MDPRLLQYYNRELQHIRESSQEFAQAYPKIAQRLSLDDVDCADPYVERLLEGFAFVAARVQLKLDSEFPSFTRHLLEIVYPQYLCPTPSMAVVRFDPDPNEGALESGVTIESGTSLRSVLGRGEQTACEFRTSQDVTLWPLKIEEAEYFTHSRQLGGIDIPDFRSGVRLRLSTVGKAPLQRIPLDRLRFFLNGADQLPARLHELLLGHALDVVAIPGGAEPCRLGRASIEAAGFREDEALLPYGDRSFHGYRLLHEYFAFPQRFLFFDLLNLRSAVAAAKSNHIDLIVLCDERDDRIDGALDRENFQLYCSPAINLFSKRADRIHLKPGTHDYHVVPDRTRPMDFEVYEVKSVQGVGGSDVERDFQPFYALDARREETQDRSFFTVSRRPRVASEQQRRLGSRTNYVGSEVYLSIVDGNDAPYDRDLKQLAVEALCTNRDLPIMMSVGRGNDFTIATGAPVESIRCLAGPTRPRPSWAEGDTVWRLISHLSLNYLSLLNEDEAHGATALRELLSLYAQVADSSIQKQIEGVESIRSKPVVRRLPVEGPIAFGRGVEIEVTMDERSFEGMGIFTLGSVLDRFFARYVSINSFTETVLRSSERGEIHRWPTRCGQRHLL